MDGQTTVLHHNPQLSEVESGGAPNPNVSEQSRNEPEWSKQTACMR